MNKICSNQVLEPTFSNHVLEIDVDSIEKFIHCSLQVGPFGGLNLSSVKYITLLLDRISNYRSKNYMYISKKYMCFFAESTFGS